jgi:hypothetical protein
MELFQVRLESNAREVVFAPVFNYWWIVARHIVVPSHGKFSFYGKKGGEFFLRGN